MAEFSIKIRLADKGGVARRFDFPRTCKVAKAAKHIAEVTDTDVTQYALFQPPKELDLGQSVSSTIIGQWLREDYPLDFYVPDPDKCRLVWRKKHRAVKVLLKDGTFRTHLADDTMKVEELTLAIGHSMDFECAMDDNEFDENRAEILFPDMTLREQGFIGDVQVGLMKRTSSRRKVDVTLFARLPFFEGALFRWKKGLIGGFHKCFGVLHKTKLTFYKSSSDRAELSSIDIKVVDDVRFGGSDITDSKFDGLCFTLRCKGEKEVVHVLAAEDKPTRQKWVESLLLAISMFAKDSQFYMLPDAAPGGEKKDNQKSFSSSKSMTTGQVGKALRRSSAKNRKSSMLAQAQMLEDGSASAGSKNRRKSSKGNMLSAFEKDKERVRKRRKKRNLTPEEREAKRKRKEERAKARAAAGELVPVSEDDTQRRLEQLRQRRAEIQRKKEELMQRKQQNSEDGSEVSDVSAESRKLEEAKRRLDDIRRKKEELLRAKGLTSTATAEHDEETRQKLEELKRKKAEMVEEKRLRQEALEVAKQEEELDHSLQRIDHSVKAVETGDASADQVVDSESDSDESDFSDSDAEPTSKSRSNSCKSEGSFTLEEEDSPARPLSTPTAESVGEEDENGDALARKRAELEALRQRKAELEARRMQEQQPPALLLNDTEAAEENALVLEQRRKIEELKRKKEALEALRARRAALEQLDRSALIDDGGGQHNDVKTCPDDEQRKREALEELKRKKAALEERQRENEEKEKEDLAKGAELERKEEELERLKQKKDQLERLKERKRQLEDIQRKQDEQRREDEERKRKEREAEAQRQREKEKEAKEQEQAAEKMRQEEMRKHKEAAEEEQRAMLERKQREIAELRRKKDELERLKQRKAELDRMQKEAAARELSEQQQQSQQPASYEMSDAKLEAAKRKLEELKRKKEELLRLKAADERAKLEAIEREKKQQVMRRYNQQQREELLEQQCQREQAAQVASPPADDPHARLELLKAKKAELEARARALTGEKERKEAQQQLPKEQEQQEQHGEVEEVRLNEEPPDVDAILGDILEMANK